MSSSRKTAGVPMLAVALALLLPLGAAAQPYPNVGRSATPKEIAAWDIDVRPDFKGLPAGSGSVATGMAVWESKCASCHGVFGESNEVFAPIVGGTTAEDIRTGRVARLKDPGFPGRTTLMKLSSLSTLWDYIHRAMPWTQPKSLSTEEVYGVTAYLLNLGGVVPDDFVLSDRNMAEVQARLPNRAGMRTDHGLWPGRSMGNGGQPDVKATACMRDCSPAPTVATRLPEHARNAHGNLADQNRIVGAQRGADTTRPAPSSAPGTSPRPAAPLAPAPRPVAAEPAAKPTGGGMAPLNALLNKHSCMACHGVDRAIVGPGFQSIAKKHQGRQDLVPYLTHKIKAGGQGVWGPMAMPPQSLSDTDAAAIAQWIATGAPR